jgi:hypothetical protein
MSTGGEEHAGAGAHAWFFDELDDDGLAAFDAEIGFGSADLGAVEVSTLDITPGELNEPHTEPVERAERLDPADTNSDVGHRSRPGRLALGLAVLAAERLRPGPPGDAFLAGVGFMEQGANAARRMAWRAARPPTRFVSRAARLAGWLPGAEASRRRLSRSREQIGRVVIDARRLGAATVAAGRTDAAVFVQHTVADGLAWAQARAVPQIVDGLVPHLVDEVVPRIIDGALPEIRDRVLPIVIEDLTTDPQVRDLVREQGMGVVGEAAEHMRTTTSTADDRIESAFRRLVRSPHPDETDRPEPPAGGSSATDVTSG